MFIRPSAPQFEVANGSIRILGNAGQLIGVKRAPQHNFEIDLLPSRAIFQQL